MLPGKLVFPSSIGSVWVRGNPYFGIFLDLEKDHGSPIYIYIYTMYDPDPDV